MSDYRLFGFRQEEKNGRGEPGALRMIAYALLDVADAIREHGASAANNTAVTLTPANAAHANVAAPSTIPDDSDTP